jgi:hypothetical protein
MQQKRNMPQFSINSRGSDLRRSCRPLACLSRVSMHALDHSVALRGGYSMSHPVRERTLSGSRRDALNETYPDDDIGAVLDKDGRWQLAHKDGMPC